MYLAVLINGQGTENLYGWHSSAQQVHFNSDMELEIFFIKVFELMFLFILL